VYVPEPLKVLEQVRAFISGKAQHQRDGRRSSATMQKGQDAEHGKVCLRQCGKRHVGSLIVYRRAYAGLE
jgi:hypothetical protein